MTLWVQFKDYLTRLSKKWVLWLFLVGDSLGVIVAIINPSLKVPLPTYWGLAVIGLLWAGFQVYRDVLIQLPRVEVPRPRLGIELTEGSEYSYSFSPNASIVGDAAKAHIVIHVRISNLGNTDLDILSIKSECQPFEGPWYVEDGKPFSEGEGPLNRAIHLTPGMVLNCDLKSDITPNPSNDVRFAARLASVNVSTTPMQVTIRVETVDETGKINDFWTEFEIATRPMRDLYLKSWCENNNAELLRLAKMRGPEPELKGELSETEVRSLDQKVEQT